MVILLAGLIGFIDLGDVNLNYATIQEINVIAFHQLSLSDQSVINPFESKFPLPQKVSEICQTKCAIKVSPLTCDVTYANCKIYVMHAFI